MSRKRPIGTVPQPPWSYAPSEVAEWMASTAGPRPHREPRPRRQVRVKGFVGHGSISGEGKLLRHFAQLGFEPAPRTRRFRPVVTRFTQSGKTAALDGKLGEIQVHIRLRKRAALELHVTFIPRVSARRATKLLSKLGLQGFSGTWT